MHSKLLTLIAALAVGGATGAVAFTSVRDTGPAPEQTSVSVPVAPAAASNDPCADPASTDPACVVVVPVPAAAVATSASSSDDDGTADQGRGDAAPAPFAPGVKLRGDGTVDDCCGGADDDRSGRRGGDDDSDDDDDDRSGHRDGDSDDRDDDSSPDDDGTPDQGSGDR